MKPEPLKLEDLKEFAPNELEKETMSMMVYGLYKEEKLVDTKEEAIELAFSLINEVIDKIKQKVKSACEFYLRYKNEPVLLVEDFPELERDVVLNSIVNLGGKGENFFFKNEGLRKISLEKYNEWLFRLAFRDVLGGENE